MKTCKTTLAVLLSAGIFFFAVTVHAQQPPAAAPAVAAAPVPAVTAVPVPDAAASLTEKFKDSFFLSVIDIELIRKALVGKVTDPEILKEDAPVPVKETIEVSGILYRGPGDWIVWLNGEKLTPQKLLPQITEITVESAESVSLRWYDGNRKKIVPVTLRPRQVYDVQTGVLSAAGR